MEKRFFQGLQRDPRYPQTDMGEHPISGCHHGRHLGVAVGFRGPVMQVIDQSLRTGF